MIHITTELETRIRARIDWLEQKLRAMREVDGPDYMPSDRLRGRIEGEAGCLRWILGEVDGGTMSESMSIAQYQQRPEATGTYTKPEHGWTCFFCGETFTTFGAATDHFGLQPCEPAACQIKVGEERGLLMALRRAQKEHAEWQLRALEAEQHEEAAQSQLESYVAGMRGYLPFRACGSMQDVFNLYDSMEGRALAAEERELALSALLNTPEIEDFDKAVPLEAAHQVLRWGAEKDAGKSREDWFWLLGYLAGKALSASRAGDVEKAKHHCISSAAVLRNWHAHLRSGSSVMRPGISEEKAESAQVTA